MCSTAVHIAHKPIRRGLTINQVNRYDPTRTLTIRNRFVSDMNKRFRVLRGKIRWAIVDQDVFGMSNGPTTNGNGVQANVQRRAFDFPRSQDKITAFMSWLQEQVDEGILQIGRHQQMGDAVEQAWTNMYIEDTYKRGVQRARYEMRKAGYPVQSIAESGGLQAVMGQPFHMDRVGLLYARTYNELKGVTDAMDQQISRVLAQAMADGDNPMLTARKLNATISGKGIGELGLTDSLKRYIPAERRARMIARTETIRAHHQATIQEYRNWQVEGVRVQAEWRTAGDERVCDECQALEAQQFTLAEVEGMIPLHPNCRCVALPVSAGAEPITPTTPQNEWEDLTLQELKDDERDKLGRVGISYSDYDGRLNEQALKRVNMAGETIGDIHSKFPDLKQWATGHGDPYSTRHISLHLHSKGGVPGAGSEVLAQYDWSLRQIHVSKRSLMRTTEQLTLGRHNVGVDYGTSLRHEYGHHIWRKKLGYDRVSQIPMNSPERQAWRDWHAYFNKHGGTHSETLKGIVSEYSTTNAEEFFTESFAAYSSPLYKKGMLPTELENLLTKLVGRRLGL